MSYLSGALFYSISFYWLYHISFLAPPAVGLVFGIYFLLFPLMLKFGCNNLYLLPFAWVLLEFLQEILPVVGVPWFCLSYALVDTSIIQVSDIFGSKFISFLVVLFNVLVSGLLFNGITRRLKIVSASFLLVFLMGIFYSTVVKTQTRLEDGDNVLIVQGNIKQELKDETLKQIRDSSDKIVDFYTDLTAGSVDEDVDLVIWPETTLIGGSSFLFCAACDGFHGVFGDYTGHEIINGLRDRFGAVVTTGAELISIDHRDASFENMEIFNSVVVSGEKLKIYSKRILVPFGEQIPLSEKFPVILDAVRAISNLRGLSSFTPGREAVDFTVDKTHFGILVCYEVIFPGLIREYKRMGVHSIINYSNEAWFKESLELNQMLAISRVRAIENRISIIRSTNSGISAFIDPLGDYEPIMNEEGELKNIEGILKKKVKQVSSSGLYTKTGDIFSLICLIVILVSAFRNKFM